MKWKKNGPLPFLCFFLEVFANEHPLSLSFLLFFHFILELFYNEYLLLFVFYSYYSSLFFFVFFTYCLEVFATKHPFFSEVFTNKHHLFPVFFTTMNTSYLPSFLLPIHLISFFSTSCLEVS
jgi:hypothetical protein